VAIHSLADRPVIGPARAIRARAAGRADGALRDLWNVYHRKQRAGCRGARLLLASLS